MQTHAKKRIDVIIEMPVLKRVTACFDKADVSGYSVVPVIAGCGRSGPWSAEDQVGAAGHMAMVVCIVDAVSADRVLDELFAIVRRQIGFVTISDVAIVRSDRF